MKLIKVFLLTFITTGLFAQSKNDKLFSTVNKTKCISELTRQQESLKLFQVHSDSLNLGITQTNWTVKKGKKDSSIKLLTLAIGDNIFYYEFYQQKLNDDFDSWHFEKLSICVDSSLFRELNQVQNLKYKSNIDIDELTRLPYRATFGYGCSVSGAMPEEGMKMSALVNKSNRSELEKWLVSISRVKQAYAYLGLKLLHSRRIITLSEENLEIMRELELSPAKVYSCSGCTFWNYAPMREQLSSENVQSFIQRNK